MIDSDKFPEKKKENKLRKNREKYKINIKFFSLKTECNFL